MDLNHVFDIDEGALVSGRSEMGAAFSKARNSGKPIVLHFHGGLVSRNSSLEDAPARQAYYAAAGAYPLIAIWKTGPLEVLPDILPRLAQEALFKILVDRVTGFVHGRMKDLLSSDGSRSAKVSRSLGEVTESRMKESAEGDGDFLESFLGFDAAATRGNRELALTSLERASLEAQLRGDRELNQTIDAVLQGANLSVDESSRSVESPKAAVPQASVADRKVLTALRQDIDTRSFGFATAVKVASLVVDVIQRFINKSDHGLHATVVEEVLRMFYGSAIGTAAWSQMKQYTRAAFDPATPNAAGIAMIEELAKVSPDQRVMLVGHSAGSIFISELLQNYSGAGKRFEVVFLAPAVTVRKFKEACLDRQSALAALRIYTMSEPLESRDTLVRNVPLLGDLTWFYPKSLLYLVSGIMEEDENRKSLVDEALLGMQRVFLADYRNAARPDIVAAGAFLRDGSRTVFSIHDDADARLRTNSTSHGGFDDVSADNTSMASVAALLKQGWS